MSSKPPTLQEIDINLLHPCRFQTRLFGPDDSKDPVLVGLAASIKQDGVLEPALARPHPELPGAYGLAAGERRFRASKLAGQKSIPCLVRCMDDDTLFRVSVVENDQREALKPLEQARAYQCALDRGWTIEQCAREFGQSRRHVALRANLTKLSPEWTKAVADAESIYSRWPVAALEKIARLAPESQDELFSHHLFRSDSSVPTPTEVESVIANRLNIISMAAWKEDDETLGRACLGCPQRSDAQPDLFDAESMAWPEGEGSKKKKAGPCVRCLNTKCWEEKLWAYVDAVVAKLKAKHDRVLFIGSASGEGPDKYRRNILQPYMLRECKKTDANAVPAVYINDYQKEPGTVTWVVDPEQEKKAASKTGNKPSNNGSAKPKPDAGSVARDSFILARIHQEEARLKESKDLDGISMRQLLLFQAATFMTREELKGVLEQPEKQLAFRMMHSSDLYISAFHLKDSRIHVEVVCEALGLDLTELEAEAAAKFPDAGTKPAVAKAPKAPKASPAVSEARPDDERENTPFAGDARVNVHCSNCQRILYNWIEYALNEKSASEAAKSTQ